MAKLHDFHGLLTIIAGFAILIPLVVFPDQFMFLEKPLTPLFGFIRLFLNRYSTLAKILSTTAIVSNLLLSICCAARTTKSKGIGLIVILAMFPTVFATEASFGLFVFRDSILIKSLLESIRELFAGIHMMLYQKAILLILRDQFPDQNLTVALRRKGVFFRYCFPFTRYMMYAEPVTALGLKLTEYSIYVYFYIRFALSAQQISLYYLNIDLKWTFFYLSHFCAAVSIYFLDVYHTAFRDILASHKEVLDLFSLETILMICLFQEPLLHALAGLGLFDTDPELKHDVHYVLVIVEMICINALQMKDLFSRPISTAPLNVFEDDSHTASDENDSSCEAERDGYGESDIPSLSEDNDDDYLGPPNLVDLNVLLASLESRCYSEETDERDEAVESLCRLGSEMSEPELVELFVPLLKRLAVGESVSARVSACGLFHIPYRCCPETLKAELRFIYSQLCHDDISMVRKSADMNLVKFAVTLEPEYLTQKDSILMPAVEGKSDPSVAAAKSRN